MSILQLSVFLTNVLLLLSLFSAAYANWMRFFMRPRYWPLFWVTGSCTYFFPESHNWADQHRCCKCCSLLALQWQICFTLTTPRTGSAWDLVTDCNHLIRCDPSLFPHADINFPGVFEDNRWFLLTQWIGFCDGLVYSDVKTAATLSRYYYKTFAGYVFYKMTSY